MGLARPDGAELIQVKGCTKRNNLLLLVKSAKTKRDELEPMQNKIGEHNKQVLDDDDAGFEIEKNQNEDNDQDITSKTTRKKTKTTTK
jgi:hypothetical protein